MCCGRLFILVYLLGWLVAQPALADIDPAEYQLKSSVRSEKESQRLQAEFEADRQRRTELQRSEDESAAQKQAQEKAAWDALPYPVRLTRARCKLCHAADNYSHQRHNRIGWELIVLRMQYLNKAPLATGERSVIAAHLAQTYPASGVAGLAEALRHLAVALSPVWLWVGWIVTRTRFEKKAKKMQAQHGDLL